MLAQGPTWTRRPRNVQLHPAMRLPQSLPTRGACEGMPCKGPKRQGGSTHSTAGTDSHRMTECKHRPTGRVRAPCRPYAAQAQRRATYIRVDTRNKTRGQGATPSMMLHAASPRDGLAGSRGEQVAYRLHPRGKITNHGHTEHAGPSSSGVTHCLLSNMCRDA